MSVNLSNLTTNELLQELREAQLQLEESEQLGVNFFMGVAGYLPDTTELERYCAAIKRELERR